MRRRLLSIDTFLHDAILIDTDSSKHIKRVLVTRIDAVENQTYHDFLPRRSTFVPEFGLLDVDNVSNVLHYTMQRTGGQDLVLVVVCDGDQKLRMTIVHGWTKVVAVPEREVVGIARGSCVSHVCELLTATLQIGSVLLLNGVLDGARHWIIDAQDRTIAKLNLSGSVTAEVVGSSRSLSLTPGFRGTGVASLIWGWGSARYPESSGRIIQGVTRRRIVVILSIVRRSCSAMRGSSIRLCQAIAGLWANWRGSGASMSVVVKRAIEGAAGGVEEGTFGLVL